MKTILTLVWFLILSLVSYGQNCLIADYPFNSNPIDATGNGHDGIIYGASLTTDRNETPYSAFNFEHFGDYIEILNHQDIQISSELTLSAWIMINQTSSHFASIIEKGNTEDGWGYLLAVNENNQITFKLHDTTGAYNYFNMNSSQSINLNTWYHITAVFNDSNFAKIYIDGIADNTITTFNTEHPFAPTSANLHIGARIGWIEESPSFPFYGKIDEVKIYNCALNDDQVRNLSQLSTMEHGLNNSIKVYPNPTSNRITINELDVLNAQLEIFNTLGESLQVNIAGNQVDMSNLNSGIYYLIIKDKNNNIVKSNRIIKN